MNLKRLAHRLFPSRHRFERFELKLEPDAVWVMPRSGEVVWYVGYRCSKCGEPGYPVPVR